MDELKRLDTNAQPVFYQPQVNTSANNNTQHQIPPTSGQLAIWEQQLQQTTL